MTTTVYIVPSKKLSLLNHITIVLCVAIGALILIFVKNMVLNMTTSFDWVIVLAATTINVLIILSFSRLTHYKKIPTFLNDKGVAYAIRTHEEEIKNLRNKKQIKKQEKPKEPLNLDEDNIIKQSPDNDEMTSLGQRIAQLEPEPETTDPEEVWRSQIN